MMREIPVVSSSPMTRVLPVMLPPANPGLTGGLRPLAETRQDGSVFLRESSRLITRGTGFIAKAPAFLARTAMAQTASLAAVATALAGNGAAQPELSGAACLGIGALMLTAAAVEVFQYGRLFSAVKAAEPASAPAPTPVAEITEYFRDPKIRQHFRNVYGDKAKTEEFAQFFYNVFSVLPPEKYDALIRGIMKEGGLDDFTVFKRIVADLPSITPNAFQGFKLALATLKHQRAVLGAQTVELLGNKTKINGYVEIGTKGDYVNTLKKSLDIGGLTYLVTFQEPTNSPKEIVQRGQLGKVGEYVDIKHYAPIPDSIPNASVDLVTMYIGLHHIPQNKIDAFIASVARILRPGGKFILRDHDLSDDNEAYVHLAHATFNAGTGESLRSESRELRNFHPLSHWIGRVEAQGLVAGSKRLAQDGDPTDNILLSFTKPVTSLEEIKADLKTRKGYARPENQSYLTLPEWDQVFRAQELGEFLKTRPSYEFPYLRSIAQYVGLNAKAFGVGGWNFSYASMNAFIGSFFTTEFLLKSALEKAVWLEKKVTGSKTTDPEIAQYAADYGNFIPLKPWYDFDFATRLATYNKTHGLSVEGIAFNIEYGLKKFGGKLIHKATKATYGEEPERIGLLISDPENKLEQAVATHPRASEVKTVESYGNGLKFVEMPRYAPFTDLIQSIANSGVRVEDIAGNGAIQFTVVLNGGQELPESAGITELYRYPSLTVPGRFTTVLKIDVTKMGDALKALASQGLTVQHVYDY